jgi:hypothetical protein
MRHIILSILTFTALAATSHTMVEKVAAADDAPASTDAITQLARNEVPIVVGGAYHEPNTPFVSVTVCAPGTSECQTIDHIVLDSGSSGLRLFSSIVSLPLAAEKVSSLGSQVSVGECMLFGGGSSFWGPVVLADVILGREKAARVPIQLWDPAYESKPADCPTPTTAPIDFGANGILGISPAQTDCSGRQCPLFGGPTYYICDSSGTCSETLLPHSKHIQNPVSLLKNDNNGVVISFPALSQGGVASASGTMFLGIGTRANNRVKKGTHVLRTNYDGGFEALVKDQIYPSRFDTGTASWNLPRGLAVNSCRGVEASNHYLCPDSVLEFSTTLRGIDREVGGSFSFHIGNAENRLKQGFFAADDYGQSWGGWISGEMIFGMSFFYGRTVYFGIVGRDSPVGTGPFEAF